MKFDDLDLSILKSLQSNAKATMQELADDVNSSPSQVWRRIKSMQDAGVITGYRAQLDARKLGLNAIAYVHVALADHAEHHIDRFMRIVESCEEIVECASITGDHDFLLKVVAETPEAMEHFIMHYLLRSGLVRETRSNFVLSQRKTGGRLPLRTSV